ncbi:efflux RND transporter permease subunit, partial [Escherichia coli]|uniref:efflux RND transporter permease subunit n=2 Tax=Enterobacterales TaxID=91347 RepID=UPI0019D30CD5
VVSLTLTPMMCARLLKPENEIKHNRFEMACERFFEKMIAVYAVWLKRVLNHQWITLGVALSTLVLTILLYLFIPKGFFPLQDNGLLQGTIESSQSISYQAMVEKQQHVVDKLIEDPAIDNIASFVGIDGSNATLNTGRLQITLKPLDQRDSRVDTIIPRLQARIASISG